MYYAEDKAFYLLPLLDEVFNHGRNYEKADRAEKKAIAWAHSTYAQ